MIFEYDNAKSQTNREKHGIDFEEAQQLWSDKDAISIAATYQGEERFMFIGKIDGKIWSAIATYRRNTIRIISVRRARKMEIKVYENDRIG